MLFLGTTDNSFAPLKELYSSSILFFQIFYSLFFFLKFLRIFLFRLNRRLQKFLSGNILIQAKVERKSHLLLSFFSPGVPGFDFVFPILCGSLKLPVGWGCKAKPFLQRAIFSYPRDRASGACRQRNGRRSRREQNSITSPTAVNL